MYITELVREGLKKKTFNRKIFLKLCKKLELPMPQKLNKNNFPALFYELINKLKSLNIVEFCEITMDLYTITEKQKEILLNMVEHPINVLIIGKGGGKDFMISLLYNFMLFHASCDEELSEFTRINFVNVAPNDHLANNVFFKEFKAWFLKCKVWQMIGIDRKKKQRAPICLLETRAELGEKITLFSGNSRATSFEGMNALCVVADEVSDPDFKNAEQLFEQGMSSAKSRFKDKAKVVAITWTRFPTPNPRDDVGYRLYQDYKAVDEAYTFKGKTWEVNTRVSKEDFKAQYQKNPILARCMYECEPPELNAYFISLEALEARHKVGMGLFTSRAMYENNLIRLEFKQLRSSDKTIYCHTDLAINKDKGVIALSYFDKGKVIISDIITLAPTLGHKIDYLSLENFYNHLQNHFSVKFTFDQFQSEYFIQKFRGERLSKHVKLWNTFQELVEGTKEYYDATGVKRKKSKIEIQCNEDVWQKLRTQILQHQIDGNKVIYFGEASADYADAVISSAYNCITNNVNTIDDEDMSFNMHIEEDEVYGEEFEFGSLL